MLNQTNARAVAGKVINPIAGALVRMGVSPDAVTITGTVCVSLAAVIFFPSGRFVIGVIIIVLFVFSDMLDGAMARMTHRKGPWGAFLDSTLDRVADGFVFGSLLIWAAATQSAFTTAAALIALVASTVISYAKARAEGLDMTCNIGIAERTERLILVLAAAFLCGLGVPYILPAALWVLAALAVLTVAQRFAVVRRQAMAIAAALPDAPTDTPTEEG
ncbi:MAG: phosphatidylinositol phosphate synthase [Candidatus Nanopelagicales bacterium]